MENIDLASLAATRIEVDLSALTHNFVSLSRYVAPARVMCVVKANAYGHGLIDCAKHLEKIGAPYFGVALLQEAIELRQAGIATPILVFGAALTDQLEYFIKYDLDITACSVDKMQAIADSAHKLKKKARVHLKIDTGMNRIGTRAESFPLLLKEALKYSDDCTMLGVFTHMARAEEDDPEFTRLQLKLFNQCLKVLAEQNCPTLIRHTANSAATLRFKDSHFDLVRPGLSLYGVYPCENLRQSIELKPVLNLKSRVVYFKVVTEGSGVGYGHTWVAARDTRIVTVPIGYGDGYLRSQSNIGPVLIRGKRYRIVGNVCMDQIMIDIGKDEAFNGEEVVLIGEQNGQYITVEELAVTAQSIPHAILASLNSRIPRVYKNVADNRNTESFLRAS